MSFPSWRSLHSALASRRGQGNLRRSGSPRTATLRPNLEVLEVRCVPTLYTVTDLGTLGGYASYATDLNEAGQVVGYGDTAQGLFHAFVWDNGTMIDLGTFGGSQSVAAGINDLGQVVGYAALPDDTGMHAFLLAPRGSQWFEDNNEDGINDLMLDLGTLNGTAYSNAVDVNNAGLVVGNSDGHAVVWDGNGMTDLGMPSGFTAIGPEAINALGQVTGTVGYDDDQGVRHASTFLWDAANGFTVLGAGWGYNDSYATDINDAGQVVGVQGDASVGYYTAFLWTPDSPNGRSGSFTDLNWVAGGYDSNANGINNVGLVVGVNYVDDGWDSYPHAFLWDGADGAVDLQYQLFPASDETLESAQAINESGAIAVNGYNGWGEYRAYLLTPLAVDPPFISVADAPAVWEGNAGTRTATFTVTLSVASTQTVTVAYTTANGTAADSDYTAASGTLTFTPGQLSRTITVQVIGDRLPEPNETFCVNLNAATNALISDGQGVGTIADDEPRISIGDVTKAEGKNGKTLFVFTVTLIIPGNPLGYDQAVSLSYATANGTAKKGEDYTDNTGTLTFAPYQTTKTITIEVKGDNKKEAAETFYVDLFGLSTNALFTRNRGIGTILNDD